MGKGEKYGCWLTLLRRAEYLEVGYITNRQDPGGALLHAFRGLWATMSNTEATINFGNPESASTVQEKSVTDFTRQEEAADKVRVWVF